MGCDGRGAGGVRLLYFFYLSECPYVVQLFPNVAENISFKFQFKAINIFVTLMENRILSPFQKFFNSN